MRRLRSATPRGLTFWICGSKNNEQVRSVPSNFYADWRLRCGVGLLLKEDDDDCPPERLVQAIWQHQRLLRDRLKTLDGQPVRVLHPGFRNVEGGPDFRGAVVQIGDSSPQTGDVEVDLRSQGWHAHGHDRNPNFQNVILHVLWDGDRAAQPQLPALKLRQALDAPLGELSYCLGSETAQDLPEKLRGKCCAPLSELEPAEVRALLEQAARIRLQSKAAQFQARARQAGWEQALWEGLFRALGYKHNIWPMQRLAELRPRWSNRPAEAVAVQARLFGISGLLPVELPRSESTTGQYVRKVWDQWWRERDEYSDCILPRTIWRFHGLRPANHPQRRLALASQWSLDCKLAAKVERWCEQEIPDNLLTSSLLETLRVEPDDFWSWHWTFRSERLKKAHPLLGATRVTDLAMNVVLPWLWVRAVEGKNTAIQEVIEHRYFNWKMAEDNSLLRLARKRLVGSRWQPTGAAEQQGLIQIVRDFCEHSNALCEECRFPELAREFCRAKSHLKRV